MEENMDPVDFLAARRRRLVGTLLGYMEENVYDKLSAEEQTALRTQVLAAVNSYYDACLDVVACLED
jgi:hypothetical protein